MDLYGRPWGSRINVVTFTFVFGAVCKRFLICLWTEIQYSFFLGGSVCLYLKGKVFLTPSWHICFIRFHGIGHVLFPSTSINILKLNRIYWPVLKPDTVLYFFYLLGELSIYLKVPMFSVEYLLWVHRRMSIWFAAQCNNVESWWQNMKLHGTSPASRDLNANGSKKNEKRL